MTIVLIPGYPNCAHSWQPQLCSLLATPIVLVPGYPNCSRSWLPQLSLLLATPIVFIPGYPNCAHIPLGCVCEELQVQSAKLPQVVSWLVDLHPIGLCV